MRYYARVAPRLLDLPSFAIVRDPVRRFLSASAYERSGGTRDRAVSLPFNARYRDFSTVDDAINHLATARSPYDIDHIFRPQAWYLLDAQNRCRIDTLVRYEEIDWLAEMVGLTALRFLPRLNCRSNAVKIVLDPSKDAFVREFYAADFDLWASSERSTQSISERRLAYA